MCRESLEAPIWITSRLKSIRRHQRTVSTFLYMGGWWFLEHLLGRAGVLRQGFFVCLWSLSGNLLCRSCWPSFSILRVAKIYRICLSSYNIEDLGMLDWRQIIDERELPSSEGWVLLVSLINRQTKNEGHQVKS